ncbi:11340_t:CDS:1 [Cetraspora pellucida]|uniref:11340_t:CDS:1 n=1 Tax=Cetraspora pellucida TaxID=1433469 RepID=A0ACA9JZ31_9GLOM|nr:11340_t:CDS:1 [Cetraspora pellucida]
MFSMANANQPWGDCIVVGIKDAPMLDSVNFLPDPPVAGQPVQFNISASLNTATNMYSNLVTAFQSDAGIIYNMDVYRLDKNLSEVNLTRTVEAFHSLPANHVISVNIVDMNSGDSYGCVSFTRTG